MAGYQARKSGILTPTKMCECCGRFVVYLRDLNGTARKPIWRICYSKAWDGNPYYNSAAHYLHPKDRFVKNMSEKSPVEEVDSFFTLE
jgi:hypothetical protein